MFFGTTAQPPFRQSLFIALAMGIFVFSGCTKSSSSSAKVTADYLEVHGSVLNGPGNGTEGVAIYLMGIDEPISRSGPNGEFRFTISDNQLYQSRAQDKAHYKEAAPKTFNLLFDLESDTRLMGLSKPISYGSRGTVEMGDVNLALPASVSGKVTRLHGDGDFTPETGIKIRIAGQETLSTEGGHFAFEQLPAGTLQAYMLRQDEPAVTTELVLAPGEELVLPYPLVILPSDEVTGWLSPLPAPDPAGVVAQSHPYRRSFKVHASPLAKYIKYYHDEAGLLSGETTASWMPVKDKIHYDFPGPGIHKLYFQFASASKETISDVRILTASTDIFTDTTGMVIGDGSGVITSHVATLQIDLPAAATEMRISESLVDFTKALPWVKAQSTYEHIFKDTPFQSLSQERELYIQFRHGGNKGSESSIYRASVRLQPFADLPTDGEEDPGFLINEGAPTSLTRDITLELLPPDNTMAYRVSEFEAELALAPFQAMKTYHTMRLSQTGMRTVYVQYQNYAGIPSPAYSQTILVAPFMNDPGTIVLNAGAAVTQYPAIDVEIVPPAAAYEMRVMLAPLTAQGLMCHDVIENEEYPLMEEGAPSHTGYTLAGPYAEVLLGAPGAYLVCAQFRSPEGDESPYISRSIIYDPFPTGQGGIAFATPTTSERLVDVAIFAPEAAQTMRFGFDVASLENAPFQPVAPAASVLLPACTASSCPVQIFVQFQSIDGYVSPAFSDTIILDP